MDDLKYCFSSIGGVPISWLPDLMSPGTPDCAPNPTLSPILACPAIPTWPPIIHHSPTLVEPAIPACAAITVCEPISSLCAICIRLSNLTPLCTTVAPIVARSTQVLAPISTLSSRITIPICGILSYPFGVGAKPNPSAPITAPECRIHSLPMRQS